MCFFSLCENENYCIKVESSCAVTSLWPRLKYIWSVAVPSSLSTSRLSSVSPVVQMGLSLLSEQQPSRPGSIVTREAAAGTRAGRKHWERWMGGRDEVARLDWETKAPWLPECLPGWSWSGHSKPPWRTALLCTAHTPLLHNTQLAAGDETGGRGWRWPAEP